METTHSCSSFPVPLRKDQLALFKGLVRSLAEDTLAALDDLNGAGPFTEEQLRALSLIHHYLSYLRRLCDGRV